MDLHKLLPRMGLVALIGFVSLRVFDNCAYYKLYNEARDKAALTIGDRSVPLTMNERKEWYSQMNVDTGKWPSMSQLRNYLQRAN
jgi:hypothetical protein